MPYTHLILLALLLPLSLSLSAAEPTQDRAALLNFINNLPHSPRIAWNTSSSACDWVGVRCDAARTSVQFLRLPGRGLLGPIPPSTLSRLTSLRVLSLHSNALSGPILPDLANLPLLRSLYLHNNLLSGGLPPSLSRLTHLSRLDLSGNDLSGEIPPTFSNLTSLTKLFLQNNKFSGGIQGIALPELVAFNVSNNQLNGSIPPELRGFPASSFAANQGLCGFPLSPCQIPSPPPLQQTPSDTEELSPPLPSPRRRKKKLSTVAIVAIGAGSGGVLLLAILLLLIFWAIRRGGRRAGRRKPQANGAAAAAAAAGGSEAPRSVEISSSLSKEEGEGSRDAGERSRLVFVGGGGGVGGRGYSFDLEDLLRASAEVLGKGSSGTSYMAVLEEGITVVVKRLKDIAASRREFEQRMDALGRIAHPNLHPIRAYYYSNDEKLLVSDFLAAGSLSALLHGGRRSGRTSPDWDSRVRIAVAVGRGLAHLHDVAKVVHGDVRSSNVLLNREPESAVLSDYGLSELHGAPGRAAAGYRAPEAGRGTYKTDVYGLGVVVLELLTGKEANQAGLGGEEGIDLARWVQSVVREEWTAEVFDVELIRYPNIEEEMVQLLQVAMACVADRPEDRPEVREAVRMMEEIVRPPPDEGSGGLGSPAVTP